MSSPLSANSHCPKSSAPSLPWRSNVPNLFSTTPIPRKASFDPTACSYSHDSLDGSAEFANTSLVSIAWMQPLPPQTDEVSLDSGALSSAEDTSSLPQPAVAAGLGAAASVGTMAIASAASSADTPSADSETSSSAASTSRPTPIPPHLLSPVPPSRPSVPPAFLGDESSSTASSSESSGETAELSASNLFEEAAPLAAGEGEDDLAGTIEGGYLDGEEALASATSFGQIDQTSLDRSQTDESRPGRDSDPSNAISMGEVVDDSALGLSTDASDVAQIGSQSAAPPLSVEDSSINSADLPAKEMTDGSQSKRSGSLLGFLSGFLIGFAIIAAVLYFGVQALRGSNSSDPAPTPESTNETE